MTDRKDTQVQPNTTFMDTQIRKRPRPVVSCLRCREKKLKCDRTTPCENCTKAACPMVCMYHQSLTSDSGPAPKRTQLEPNPSRQNYDNERSIDRAPGTGIIEDLQQRVAKLEELLSTGSASASPEWARDIPSTDSRNQPNTIAQPASSPPVLGTLVVKGTRSRYHGQNTRITLLNQFTEAKEFIYEYEKGKDATLFRMAKEVQFLQSKLQLPLTLPEMSSHTKISSLVLQLRDFFPPKPVCDKLLDIYAGNFEKSLRIIHIPSFHRQYTTFWADPDHEGYQSSAFIPQLTVILVVSFTLADGSVGIDNSTREYLKQSAIPLVQTWLQKINRKQRTELGTLQVEILLLIARHLRLQPAEELWGATGALVRSAMVMGLHLDASDFTNLSVFQTEIRRRLWLTIVEMDLQASIASGMPVMTPDLDSGSLMPANLNDVDFDESTTESPPPKPLHEWTDSLGQIALAMSFSQRIKTMAIVRTVRPGMDLNDVVKQGQRLEECLRQIPPPLKLDHVPDSDGNTVLVLNRVLLDIYIRRSLLSLYRPVIMGSSRDDPAFLEIQRVCLLSSLAILSYQDYFDPNVADLEVFSSHAYWDIFQILFKEDVLCAALSVCAYMKQSSHHPGVQSHSSQLGLMHSKSSLTRILETTLDSLIRRIGEKGNNVKDILLLSVVLQSVRTRGGSAQVAERMYQGAQKALSACRQHLLEQSFEFDVADFPQMIQSTQPIFTPSPHLDLPDFLAPSSELATEFSNFEGDPFAYDDGSFMWNI